MNKFYHINSVLCRTMKNKLDNYDIEYEEITDVDRMVEEGILTVPLLVLENGEQENFYSLSKYLSTNC